MLFLPVRPQYAAKILSGEKTIELRRRCPLRCVKGSRVLFYATSPKCELVVVARVQKVLHGAKTALWDQVEKQACVDKSTFMDYFEGRADGFGIAIENARQFSTSIDLDMLRREWPGFRPPQGFCYLSDAQICSVNRWLEAGARRSVA